MLKCFRINTIESEDYTLVIVCFESHQESGLNLKNINILNSYLETINSGTTFLVE